LEDRQSDRWGARSRWAQNGSRFGSPCPLTCVAVSHPWRSARSAVTRRPRTLSCPSGSVFPTVDGHVLCLDRRNVRGSTDRGHWPYSAKQEELPTAQRRKPQPRCGRSNANPIPTIATTCSNRSQPDAEGAVG